MSDWRSLLFRKSLAYQQCFLDEQGNVTPAARIVLADLAKFAGLAAGPIIVSPVSRVTDVPATMQRAGRAEPLLRIWRFLKLPIHQIYEIEEQAKND